MLFPVVYVVLIVFVVHVVFFVFLVFPYASKKKNRELSLFKSEVLGITCYAYKKARGIPASVLCFLVA